MPIFYGPQLGLKVRRGPGGGGGVDLPLWSTIYRIEMSKPFVSTFDSLRPSSVLEEKGKKTGWNSTGKGRLGRGDRLARFPRRGSTVEGTTTKK